MSPLPLPACRFGLVLVLAACGPAEPGPASTGDMSTGTDGAATSPTSAALDTGGSETAGATVCLAPQPEGIPVADDALTCIATEGLSGAITLVRGDWPEIVLDECAHGEVEVEVPCTATQIVEGDTDATITLQCVDDDKAQTLTLEVSTPALFFPICTGQPLMLRYGRIEFGCPNGGQSEAMVLRDAGTGAVLAATFYGNSEAWLAPIEISGVDDAGCIPTGDSCVTFQRSAVQVGDGVAAPVLVYDGTRRIVEFAARHVVEAHVVFESSADGCETFGTYEVALVRVDP